MKIKRNRPKGLKDIHANRPQDLPVSRKPNREQIEAKAVSAWNYEEWAAEQERRNAERRRLSSESPTIAAQNGLGYNGPKMPDKGLADGSCNRTACQLPLAGEPMDQFMRGNFTGGPRLHYCAKCARDFDDWDYRSGDPVRIEREAKVRP